MSVKICFISGHFFGYEVLKSMLTSDSYKKKEFEVSLLISLDETKKENTVGFSDFNGLAKQFDINHLIVSSSKNSNLYELILKSEPSYLFVIGWSELISTSILNIPMLLKHSDKRHDKTHGCIGMHPTLLPIGRGRAPIPWTIINGLQQSGVSTFLLEEVADSGGIILQDKFNISENETATSLFNKCAESHSKMGLELVDIICNQNLKWTEQDHSLATIWGKRTPKDGLIDFNQSIIQIDRFIRALTLPYPGAFFILNDKKNIIDEINIIHNSHNYKCGEIVSTNNFGFSIIAAFDGLIEIVKIRSEANFKQKLVF